MIRFLLFILLATTISSCMKDNPKTYSVKKITAEAIIVTGQGDSPHWNNGTELTDFTYPWEAETPPLTSFKAVHNNNWLYLLYQVKDDNVQVLVKENKKIEVVYSDRVEIFFRKDDKMSPYYGLELDPHGRVYDYEATFHRQFNDQWTWPAGHLKVMASRTNEGYTVEVAISKESLKQLGLMKGNKLEAGLFRGNCIEMTEGKDSNIKWISWVRPDSETPNFHIPSAFGLLVLED
jgi:Carbohydrate family 9 binding domain-like